MSEALPVTALIFKGGGYDGCFWEWNAIIAMPDGTLYTEQPLVTGRYGREVLQRAIEKGLPSAIADVTQDHLWLKTNGDMDTFEQQWSCVFVRGVASQMRQTLPSHDRGKITLKCQSCNGRFSPSEIFHTKYSGAGGIAIQFHDNVCLECAERQHDEWIAKDVWPTLRKKDRAEAIARAVSNGEEPPESAVDSESLPISGHWVHELELH